MQELNISDIKIGTRQRVDLGDLTELRQSIRNTGGKFVTIWVNKDLELIAGERRLSAMKAEGFTKVNAIVGDIDELTKLELEFAENDIRKNLTDEEKINAIAELHRLKQMKHGVGDTHGKGWSAADTASAIKMNPATVSISLQVKEALGNEAVKAALKSGGLSAAYKAVQAEKEKVIIALLASKVTSETQAAEKEFRNPADYIKLGDSEQLIKLVPDKTVDFIFCDPPYAVGVNNMCYWDNPQHQSNTTYEDSPEFVDAMMQRLLPEFNRVMKDDSFIFFWSAFNTYNKQIEWFKAQGWFPAPAPYFWCKDENSSYCVAPDHYFASAVEYGVYARKGNPRLAKRGKLNYGLDRLVRDKIHVHEKPLDLQREIIEAVCLPGSFILDPFTGSGSIVRAALLAGMKPLGFEKDEGYYSKAILELNSQLNG